MDNVEKMSSERFIELLYQAFADIPAFPVDSLQAQNNRMMIVLATILREQIANGSDPEKARYLAMIDDTLALYPEGVRRLVKGQTNG